MPIFLFSGVRGSIYVETPVGSLFLGVESGSYLKKIAKRERPKSLLFTQDKYYEYITNMSTHPCLLSIHGLKKQRVSEQNLHHIGGNSDFFHPGGKVASAQVTCVRNLV